MLSFAFFYFLLFSLSVLFLRLVFLERRSFGRGADANLVLVDTVGEGRHEARLRSLQPRIEVAVRSPPDHSLGGDDIARLDRRRRAGFDAIVTVSGFDSRSRQMVISRAMVRADGVQVSAPASALSALRRRAAHSP